LGAAVRAEDLALRANDVGGGIHEGSVNVEQVDREARDHAYAVIR
jgi:hypothetical protein